MINILKDRGGVNILLHRQELFHCSELWFHTGWVDPSVVLPPAQLLSTSIMYQSSVTTNPQQFLCAAALHTPHCSMAWKRQ